jgi:hypothetical protein
VAVHCCARDRKGRCIIAAGARPGDVQSASLPSSLRSLPQSNATWPQCNIAIPTLRPPHVNSHKFCAPRKSCLLSLSRQRPKRLGSTTPVRSKTCLVAMNSYPAILSYSSWLIQPVMCFSAKAFAFVLSRACFSPSAE